MINKQDIKKYFSGENFKNITISLLVVVIILTIFQFGVSTGYRKALYANRFGDNFSRNFMGPRGGGDVVWADMPGRELMPEGHGAVGEIISLNFPKIVVSEKNLLEKIIIINSNTEIRKFRDSISQDDLKLGDHIVVLGSPDEEGNINAKLIRVIPYPPQDKPINQ